MKNKNRENRKKTVKRAKEQQPVAEIQATSLMTAETPQIPAKQYEALITVELPINQIVLNCENPRTIVDDSELNDLIPDIAKNGLINPITVRETENGKYQIIAGERRYRACKVLNYETISSIIKQYDNEQTTDIMMSENLIRQPLKPLDEAKKYQTLIWEKQYTIKDVAVRFNQTESYIYGRLALLNMISEIAELVHNEIISLSVANEICKYSFDIQRNVYENHLKEDDYRCWQSLSAKAFKKKLEENYSTRLSDYHFDKTGCANCMYNSEYLSMFPSEESYCKNHSCLQKLQADYVVKKTMELAKENPNTEINIPPRINVNNETVEQLSQLGVAVLKEHSKELPKAPDKPERKEFKKKEDYVEALQDYNREEKEYNEDSIKLEKAINEGKAKIVIDLEQNEPVIRYVNIAQTIAKNQTGEVSNKNMIQQLQEQDKRNEQLRRTNTNTDLATFLTKSDNPSISLHETENTLLFYILLQKLRYQNKEKLSISFSCRTEESFEICQNLTEEQKAIIIRDVIIDFATNNPSDKNELITKYMELHFPEELKTISQKYTEVYNKRHAKIEEQLKVLMPEPPKAKRSKKTKEYQPSETTIAVPDKKETPVIRLNEPIREVDYIEEKLLPDYVPESETPFEDEIPMPEPENTEEPVEQVDYIRDNTINGQEPLLNDMILPNIPAVINQQPYYN